MLDGELRPLQPEAGYPVVCAETKEKRIVSVYGDRVVQADAAPGTLILVNGTTNGRLVVELGEALGETALAVRDCRGRLVRETSANLCAGLHRLDVPPAGSAVLRQRR
uniref:CAZy families GH36 protein n=1 Tax=uncultured Flavobacteriales bacterium TaxID=213322 RepID=A0A060BPT9_9FLAO|nr:CAZy families GH36 protein [uncultured Flavobacteriales bacterium]